MLDYYIRQCDTKASQVLAVEAVQTYCVVPKFQPPTANRVFSWGFLKKKTKKTCRYIVNKYRDNLNNSL